MIKIDEYIKNQRLESYKIVQNRKIIYLDNKYWVLISKQNRETNPAKRLFLDKVQKLSESGKCIFPISEITFFELLKYHNNDGLKQTIAIVDKLSKGISIINIDERKQLEFSHFYNKNLGKEVHKSKELVWTKLVFILGYDKLSLLPTESLQKSFYNLINNKPLFEIVNELIKDDNISFSYKDDVDTLNKNKIKYANENKSFEQMFFSELAGYLGLCGNSFKDAVVHIFHKEKGYFPTDSEIELIDENKLINLVYQSFKNKKITDELPIFRIIPELFASLRWDKERKYKDGNDTFDILHASFALPYCDYFFTEDELCNKIIQRKLNEIYNCEVMSKTNDILNVLNTIMQDE